MSSREQALNQALTESGFVAIAVLVFVLGFAGCRWCMGPRDGKGGGVGPRGPQGPAGPGGPGGPGGPNGAESGKDGKDNGDKRDGGDKKDARDGDKSDEKSTDDKPAADGDKKDVSANGGKSDDDDDDDPDGPNAVGKTSRGTYEVDLGDNQSLSFNIPPGGGSYEVDIYTTPPPTPSPDDALNTTTGGGGGGLGGPGGPGGGGSAIPIPGSSVIGTNQPGGSNSAPGGGAIPMAQQNGGTVAGGAGEGGQSVLAGAAFMPEQPFDPVFGRPGFEYDFKSRGSVPPEGILAGLPGYKPSNAPPIPADLDISPLLSGIPDWANMEKSVSLVQTVTGL